MQTVNNHEAKTHAAGRPTPTPLERLRPHPTMRGSVARDTRVGLTTASGALCVGDDSGLRSCSSDHRIKRSRWLR
ncbi:hypothetical protein AWV79_13910 [Cupriavidus sp. UYMMa02A]|nr:hypothetical protein AWV79_13910 [Cupriavidus sp. UYMMa02A]